ncbi:MAG: helix-turn-helix transcriptional regulator, partial [Gemmatimonadota bacterium]
MARTRRFPPDRSRSPAASDLTRGRAAYDRREWQTAYEALSAADEAAPLGAADLWLLASAAFLAGHEAAFVAALERVHGAHLDASDRTLAARAAIWLGLHLAERGEPARATGWFGRADRVLEGVSSGCAERGYLLLPQGIRHLASGDHEAAARLAGEAAECAQQFGDRDLLALAVHLQGRARLRQARVEEGLALLDEAMVAVTTGELSPQVTGLIYCSVISACRRVWALDRAHEWTAALTDWCEAQPEMVAFRGECRVYRAELMRLHGSWGAA